METIDPRRSGAIREVLVDYVRDHPARRRPVTWGVGLVLVGAIAGVGGAAGAVAVTSLLAPGPQQPSGQPSPALPAEVKAPEGTIPGAPVIETVGDPITVTVDTATAVPLTGRPESATHARVTITPAAPVTDAGSLVFGTDPGGNNPSFSWTLDDVEAGTNLDTNFDFPLDSSVTTLYLEPSGFEWLVTIQYVIHVPTEFGVNAEGDSYGISGDERGEPTLIAAVTTNGKEGYVYRQDLEDADGTTAMKSFKSPDDALAWQEAHAGEVITIPVYEADGKTKVGKFEIGG